MLKTKFYFIFVIFFIISISFNNFSLAQNTFTPSSETNFAENILFDDTMSNLKKAILHASKKQSLYAYNISNATTPEFNPVLEQDEYRQLASILPPGEENNRKVMMEFILTKMSENRLKYNAYFSLQKKKFEILRQVATQGKK
ncbi:MAG: hypothetical protein GY730_00595 [bacterium]|nr:hypothetical protein [bacterium]